MLDSVLDVFTPPTTMHRQVESFGNLNRQVEPVSPSVMYDHWHPHSKPDSTNSTNYWQSLREALPSANTSSQKYQPSYVTKTLVAAVHDMAATYAPEDLVYSRGRALLRIASWSDAQKLLKANEKLVGLVSDDGSNYRCPVITNESEFQYYYKRYQSHEIAKVGMVFGSTEPLCIKIAFYAMPAFCC